MALLRLVGLLHRASYLPLRVEPRDRAAARLGEARKRAGRTSAGRVTAGRLWNAAARVSKEAGARLRTIPPGSMPVWRRNCLAGASGAVLPCGGPRCRDACGRPRRTPSGTTEWRPRRSGVVRTHAPRTRSSARFIPVFSLPSGASAPGRQGPHGREAHLARGARRAPGRLVAGQLRDVAAPHLTGRRGRHALSDRGAEWLREGLAGDPLPPADLADAGPHRGLQRAGGVRRSEDAGQPAAIARPTAPAAAGPRRAHAGRRGGRLVEPERALHLRELHRRLRQPARPRGRPVGRRAPGPRLQPALPLRRGGAGQDAPDARDRQRRHRPLPAQEGRLRHQREVHQRVHHEHPAGPHRRLPGPLPADRPPPDRRHPVHRRQGADPGGVLPHLQRDPRGRQADRPLLGPAAQSRSPPSRSGSAAVSNGG